MRRIALFVTLVLSALTMMAQSVKPKVISLNKKELLLVQHNNDFAFRLFRQARTDESLLLSPLGITYDLGMLNNGADGITRDEIDALLGSKDIGGADLTNSFCRKMLDECPALDKMTKVAIANNIYVNSSAGCKLLDEFAATAKKCYDALPESRDFGDGKTRDAINEWATKHTEGMIEEAVKESEFRPDAVSYLLNALYFKGEWTHKFNAKETRLHQFDDGRAEVQMMHQQSDFAYTENKTYQAIILPYGNTAYQMTVFLPQRGRTLDDLLKELDGNNWQRDKYEACNVNLYLPRFETSTDMRLEDVMKALGMPNAFEGGYGFNQVVDDNVFIGIMKQVAKIKLDEEGTEASAVTVIELDKGASTPRYVDFVADRPFLYVITEQSSGAIFFIGQYMGEPLKNQRHDISLTDDEKQLVKGNNDFAFRLFRQARGTESNVMSPLSVTYALGMLNNGADGVTRQEINTVLGSVDVSSPDVINSFCSKLLTEAPTLDETTTAEIANTIYVNSSTGYELQQGFVDKANQYYNAKPEALSFFDQEATIATINQWANDHTHGMIPKVLNKETFNASAASYLLSALYFKGTWANKFDKAETCDEPFDGDGMVPMMHQTEHFQYTENEHYQAVQLPYGNGAFLMTVFLPRKDKTLDDLLDQLDGSNWQKPEATRGNRLVDLKMPRFTIETDLPLVDAMKKLGLTTAFDPKAEFPHFGNREAFIGNMFQKAKIMLDEEGTEAAAVTVIEMTESLPMSTDFHADRPFLYVISEQSTGAIFFMGQYMGEAKKGVTNAVRSVKAAPTTKGYYNLNGQLLTTSPTPGIYISDGQKVVVR